MARKPRHVKSVNLALQGGGAHGAFTWGVLDRMFEEDKIWIEAISGTSAGAMNAVVAAQGMYRGQATGAREALRTFWNKVASAGASSPLKRGPLDILTGSWNLEHSPGYMFMDFMNRLASPYDLNPMNLNVLRDLVDEFVDFDAVRRCVDLQIYVSATNVETGQARVFHRDEITIDAVMASACLPFMFQAVEIEGEHYWDGGYMGNPPLLPFYHESPADDLLIVQINPMSRKDHPTSAREILNRVNEITFNGALLHELRSIEYVHRLLDAGAINDTCMRRMHVHIIQGTEKMEHLNASSKLNTEPAFLEHLFEIGREAADEWLDVNFDHLGNKSTVDLSKLSPKLAKLPDPYFCLVPPNKKTGTEGD